MTIEKQQSLTVILNDPTVITALRTNLESEHWKPCTEYIRAMIEHRFSSLSPETKDDAVQEAVALVYYKISTFRGESKFTTWISSVAYNHTVDMIRRQKGQTEWEVASYDQLESYQNEVKILLTRIIKMPEEVVLRQELIDELLAEFEEFSSGQRKYERNRYILPMLFHEDTYKEIAEVLGVTSAVVSSVFYAFRDYMQGKFTDRID